MVWQLYSTIFSHSFSQVNIPSATSKNMTFFLISNISTKKEEEEREVERDNCY